MSSVQSQAAFIDTRAAAQRTGISPEHLRRLRRIGGGPAFIKIGKIVRYRVDALDQWLRSFEIRSTSEAAAAATEGGAS